MNVAGLCLGNPLGYSAFHSGVYVASGTQQFKGDLPLVFRLWCEQFVPDGYDALALWTPEFIPLAHRELYHECLERYGNLVTPVLPRQVRLESGLEFPSARDYVRLVKREHGADASFPEALAVLCGRVLARPPAEQAEAVHAPREAGDLEAGAEGDGARLVSRRVP
jgi:hypothetical protein